MSMFYTRTEFAFLAILVDPLFIFPITVRSLFYTKSNFRLRIPCL